MSIEYIAHPLADLIPPMNDNSYAELKTSIADHGLSVPIVLYEGKILDGRHRYRACKESGIEPTFRTYTNGSPVSEVVALNVKRRDLTKDQRAVLAVELLPELEREAAERRKATEGRPRKGEEELVQKIAPVSKSRDLAGAMVGVNRQYVSDVKAIKAARPEAVAEIKAGTITIADVKRDMQRLEHQQRVDRAAANPKPASVGPFGVILADPPWRYDFSETGSREIENHYNTASADDIASKPPNSSDDSCLFLWATAPKLLEAIHVMRQWGFTYKTQAVWDKEKPGMGYWFRGQHEILLVGTKGNFRAPLECVRVSSVFREPRGEHSVKPRCVYEWIEKAFPEANKLEMFARTTRPGWASYGNEL